MAAARKPSRPKSVAAPAPKQIDPEDREAAKAKAKAKARQSAAKGGRKSADAKSSSSASAREARPTNPDAMEADVIELITAIDEYKRKFGRPFPSWSEILDIVKGLGYGKAA